MRARAIRLYYLPLQPRLSCKAYLRQSHSPAAAARLPIGVPGGPTHLANLTVMCAPTHENTGGDTTATVVEEETKSDGEAVAPAPAPTLVLRLNLRPHISFANDTVDNEHLGRKSSKRCCIYHKKRPFGESSTESSGSDCDDPDCRKNKSVTRKKGSGGGDDGVQESKEDPPPAPAPAPAPSEPGAGWGSVKRRDRVPDYQRFHA